MKLLALAVALVILTHPTSAAADPPSTIDVGTGPNGLALSSDGKRLYVTNQDSNDLSEVDTGKRTVVRTISQGNQPSSVAVGGEGGQARVFVSNAESNTITVMSNLTAKDPSIAELDENTAGLKPSSLAASADGKVLYVSSGSDNEVRRLTYTSNNPAPLSATVEVGSAPNGLALVNDVLYVTNGESNDVSVLNVKTLTVRATVEVGVRPNSVTTTAKGDKVFVTNHDSNTLSIISVPSPDKATVTATVTIPPQPTSLALSPDEKRLYISHEGRSKITVIDASTSERLADLTMKDGTAGASGANGIAVSPDGEYLYVINNGGNTVVVVKTKE
ncbi:YncE family protein [Amycolatopsis sp. cmx-11-12]|uniref:YncE family protein n=1 Tax=Amycolatopsis sp. cmx-11-12 TaxID=2785795 RepID=UPI00391819E6